MKDSWHFYEKTVIPHEHELLFLDIYMDLALEVIMNRWNQIGEHANLNEDQFQEVLECILNSSYFRYDNQFFKQIYGIPMGNSISAIIKRI
ncbi:hypothetical protein Zmor_007061 [Zophobas morio]|uniref:Uncharacterized protein n=1 Tax=Zophobas morio TaxID=2755281 RepID=A0AA38IT66_9CUCU|nr:hypothetical protein Zmor_007061 [Zophobas morio]